MNKHIASFITRIFVLATIISGLYLAASLTACTTTSGPRCETYTRTGSRISRCVGQPPVVSNVKIYKGVDPISGKLIR